MSTIIDSARFVGRVAVAYDTGDAVPVTVAPDRPFPVSDTATAHSDPVAGSMAGSGTSPAFAAVPGYPLWLELAGSWSGEALLQRSGDGGASWRALTAGGEPAGAFRASVCEPVGFESQRGALYRLVFAFASGTADYRISQ